ncbi:MAG: AtpZ/AtpI family protein [Ignavibacteriales bacterium]|nr:AtpZ/AtpI family protein [Ignavibacteriales bacterium]
MLKNEDSVAESLRGVAPYMGLGIQLAVTITGMVLLGNWLDKEYDTKILGLAILDCRDGCRALQFY